MPVEHCVDEEEEIIFFVFVFIFVLVYVFVLVFEFAFVFAFVSLKRLSPRQCSVLVEHCVDEEEEQLCV